MDQSRQQFAHINVFTPRPGLMEDFVIAHLEGLPGFGDVPGSRGSRLYRANDDRNLILISFFENEAAHTRFTETPAFQQHRTRLRPFLEGTAPNYYTLIHSEDRL